MHPLQNTIENASQFYQTAVAFEKTNWLQQMRNNPKLTLVGAGPEIQI